MKKIILLFIIPSLIFSQIDCTTFDSWPASDPLGGPNQNSWCEWCLDYANNPGQPFNATGINWGDPNIMCDCCNPAPLSTWECGAVVGTCYDPGDGTGQYMTLADCEAACLCTTFDSWPESDPLGGPNQNSWCEWCMDYANNPGQPFNATGINWGDPNTICDCCDSGLIINEPQTTKTIIKTISLLGQELQHTQNHNQWIIYIYDDGTVEKKYLIP